MDIVVTKEFCPPTELVMNLICIAATKYINFDVHKFYESESSVKFYFICRSKMNVEEIVELLAEGSDGGKLPSVSSPKQSPIKVKGPRSRKLDFPPHYQQPSTPVTVTSSLNDDSVNNNDTNVVSSSDNSDSQLFPEDVCGSKCMGSISESETSDYTSEDESFPPPRKILNKEKSKPGGKATAKKNKT
jgi:hypothetical protein